MSSHGLLATGLVGAALLAFACGTTPAAAADARTTTPIKHFISILQENHTYDNYFGTYPHGDGLPDGVCMPMDPAKQDAECVRPFHIGDNDVVPRDLDHSFETYQSQLNGGRMNGFIRALDVRNEDGRLAMGYRDDRDIPYYWNLADEYVLFDRFFSSAGAGSFMNHLYWVTGGPGSGLDRITTTSYDAIPTIFDRLERRGISWKFYVQNYDARLNYRTLSKYPANRASQVIWVPLLNYDRYIDDPKLAKHIVDLDEFFTDLENDTLPAVAYIAPSGPSEHPPSSLTSGQAFMRTLLNGLMRSGAWKTSAFLLAYDDWGGWYDHVRPPRVDRHGYGFRVPALLVSPYARKGYVDSTTLDFTSILRFIEQNWGLRPLTGRDARANSFADAFDFRQPPRKARFVSTVRETPRKREPRRGVIYALYGGAMLLTVSLVARAARASSLRRRAKPPTPDEARAARA